MLPTHPLVLSLLLAAPLSAQMVGVYTVNPLVPATPSNFPSLTAAVNALNTQGVIGPVWIEVYDDAGPYTEAFPFLTSNGPYPPQTAGLMFAQWTGVSTVNRVTFRPGPGESPVIDAAANAFGVFWNGADYVTLQGFEIRNALFDGISLYTEASLTPVVDAIITGCRIHHCTGSGVCVYGNSVQPVNTLIENCFFWHLQTNNSGSFNTTARFGYVTTRRATGTRVVNNSFFIDTATGSMFCAVGTYASSTAEVTYAEVRNNAFFRIAGGGSLFRYQTPAGSSFPLPLIQDGNCFLDTTANPFALYGPNATTSQPTLAAWQLATGLDAVSVPGDPQYLDAPGGDLHIAAGSPCRIVGLATGTTHDIDGQARLPVIMDIGADQWSSATIATVGSGCPGTGSVAPVLYSQQWPFLGNGSFAVLDRQAPPSALIIGFISLGTGAAFPLGFGCNGYLQLGSLVTLPGVRIAGPAGTAGLLIPLPGNPGLSGVQIGLQDMVLDAGAPMGFTVTNALGLVLGF